MYIDYGIKNKIEFCIDIILKEAIKEDKLVRKLLFILLSAYTNNPINLTINAPSGVGKNYVINKVSEIFPKVDMLYLSGMTDKALFHRPGKLVIKNEKGEYEPIEQELAKIEQDLKNYLTEKQNCAEKTMKQSLESNIKSLLKKKNELLTNTKKLIDLSHKIIIFLDTPSSHLLSGLLPLLSHDKYEVEYEFVDTHNGIKTKSNVLRGWPCFIFAQAIDYSNDPRYPEIQRRFILANPEMSPDKFKNAIGLISNKYGVPDFIYQQQIVSDQDKEKAKEIIIGLKEKIMEISGNGKPGKVNIVNPYSKTIEELLPKKKSSDMTFANRLFTFLSLLPIIYYYKRPKMIIRKQGNQEAETISFATIEDVQQSCYLMEYSDGVRPYVLQWFYNVFLPVYNKKQQPDFQINCNGQEITEERIAVTSRELIESHSKIMNEDITTKKLLDGYLYPLMNQGYIDKIQSKIDKRANIYYPVITRKYINLFENDESNKSSQHSMKIAVDSSIFPSIIRIKSQIESIIKCYSDNGFMWTLKNHEDKEITIDELVQQYYSNQNDLFEIQEQEGCHTCEPTKEDVNHEEIKLP